METFENDLEIYGINKKSSLINNIMASFAKNLTILQSKKLFYFPNQLI